MEATIDLLALIPAPVIDVLALGTTLPGIAGLVTAGGAVAAIFYMPRATVPLAALSAILLGVAYVDRISDSLALHPR